MTFELVGVPFSSMHPPGGIARAIAVLRELGLAEATAARGDVRDAGDLRLAGGDGRRGPSGLLNEAALARLVAAMRDAVAASLSRGRRPLLVGGDARCSSARSQPSGTPKAPPASCSSGGGQASSCPSACSGRPTGRSSTAPASSPCAATSPISRLTGTWAHAARSQRRGPAVGALRSTAPGFWLHVDLDVLSTAAMPAVDYPQAGGIAWAELDAIAVEALAATDCSA